MPHLRSMIYNSDINYLDTVMTLSFRTDRSGQTVQTQIRLLLEEQSGQGLHVLIAIPFASFWVKYTNLRPLCLNFR